MSSSDKKQSSSFVKVGKIHSAQGIRGEVFVLIFAGEAAWMDQWDRLYIAPESEESPVRELVIRKFRIHQKQRLWGFAAQVESIDDRNQAEELKGQMVFVPEEFLVSGDGEEIYLREVLGFRVVDKERGDVGQVVGFSGNDFQDLLVIKNDKGEYEVPFVEPIHLETRKDKKELLMDIPAGLVAGEEL